MYKLIVAFNISSEIPSMKSLAIQLSYDSLNFASKLLLTLNMTECCQKACLKSSLLILTVSCGLNCRREQLS